MRVINLTMPLSAEINIGHCFPWDSPFRTEDITNYSDHGVRLFHICAGSETGTRLVSPRFFQPAEPDISDVSLSALVNRPTSVITVPKSAGSAIGPLDIERGFTETEIHPGDAVLIRTGWGDEAHYETTGDQYVLESPFFTPGGARRLIQLLNELGVDLLLTDCVYLDRVGEESVRKDWTTYPFWLRPPYPSDQARAYLQQYTRRMSEEDWTASRIILEKCWAILALVNCGEIKSQRVQITCLPMFVVNAGGAPCTVIATELDFLSKKGKGSKWTSPCDQ